MLNVAQISWKNLWDDAKLSRKGRRTIQFLGAIPFFALVKLIDCTDWTFDSLG